LFWQLLVKTLVNSFLISSTKINNLSIENNNKNKFTVHEMRGYLLCLFIITIDDSQSFVCQSMDLFAKINFKIKILLYLKNYQKKMHVYIHEHDKTNLLNLCCNNLGKVVMVLKLKK
jgi:hypothetical protein